MPKEATHWIAARQTAARLAGTGWGEAALRCPNALQMGAVFPDLPYYLAGSSEQARQAAALGNRYHGAGGEDTYDLLRALLVSLREEDEPAHRAFLVGVASHLCVDAVFHPWVYYETGNYYDPDPARRTQAVRDHRRFEGLLDLAICGNLAKARSCRARTIWQNLERPPEALLEWAARHQEPAAAGEVLTAANGKFLWVQSLIAHPAAARVAGGLEPLLPAGCRELTALFLREPAARDLERLRGRLEYRNPVSGESRIASVEELLGEGVEPGAAACRGMERAIGRGSASDFAEHGPSLNFGLVAADVAKARFFASPAFFAR